MTQPLQIGARECIFVSPIADPSLIDLSAASSIEQQIIMRNVTSGFAQEFQPNRPGIEDEWPDTHMGGSVARKSTQV